MKPFACFSATRLIAIAIPFLVLPFFSVFVSSRGFPQQNTAVNQPERIELGKPIEKELAGGSAHSYQIALTEGQFLKVAVELRQVDVIVRLMGPDDKLIAESGTESGKQESLTVEQVAEASGNYRLTVQAKQKDAPAGRYVIRLAELRASTGQERALFEARRLYPEFVRRYRAGNYGEAIPIVERIAQLQEQALGSDHPDVARSLVNLAILNRATGAYAKAEPLYQRALATLEKALGPDHIDVATILNNFASLHDNAGNYAKAEALYQRSLAIREKTLGAEHPDVAASLHNLAILSNRKGDYNQAELLYLRALAIKEKALGPEHSSVALTLNSLAILYGDKGDWEKAERIYQRSLAIKEKTLGPEHPDFAATLHNLGTLYRAKDEYAKAEPLYQRALAILEKKLGTDHPDVADVVGSLANLYTDRGDFAKAEPLYQRNLTINEKTRGSDHPNVAGALQNLGSLYRITGDYARAASFYQRALAIWEKSVGPDHPDVATALNNLARLHLAKGETAQAIEFQARASRVSERNLALNLATGSERQKLAYLAMLAPESDQTVSLHVSSAPNDGAARKLAAGAVLQRKGRTLEAVTDSFAALRGRFNAQDQILLDQLKDASAQLARLTLNGPQRVTLAEHQQKIKALEEEKEKLEADISRRSAEFRAQVQPVTLETVQAAIPSGAALVEFTAYRPFNARYVKPDEAFGKPRYVAYVLRQQGEPQWADLGEAKPIDDAIAALRKAMRDPDSANVNQLARAVDEKVMRPVRKLVGETRRLLVSPDGMLNLAPLAALVDEQNRFLVERYSITYLSSGRDLLRLQVAREGKSAPLVIANPDFGLATGEALAKRSQASDQTAQTSESRSEFKQISYGALPWTIQEASDLKKLMPQAALLVGAQATESSLKRASAPRILHIATHGFFLQDAENPVESTRGFDSTSFSDLRSAAWAAKIENPLLRSGLALAGFNEHRGGDDDGVLTAMEAASLDLWGTKLVVLSACDTGVGEVKNGEGVYGLRRALALAGAETQVMSLWKVSDKETRSLMAGYYKRLLKGEGRGEALRQAQLEMLKDAKLRHPHYWASFIQAGEWANLDGKR